MGVVDDFLEGWKRKAGLGDTGEAVTNYFTKDQNTFGRKDRPEGIDATYVDVDKDGNEYTGRTIGQTVSRKPYEKAKERNPVSTALGGMAGSATVQAPVFAATSGIGSIPGRLLRNYLTGAGEHAISEEQGGLSDKVKGTAKWSVDNPLQTAVNTLLPEVMPHALKGLKAGVGKLLGRAPKEVPMSKGGMDEAEMDDIMRDIADYEATHGEQTTAEDRAKLVRELIGRRRPDLVDVPESIAGEPPANGNRTIAANDNAYSKPRASDGDVDLPDIGKPARRNVANDNINIPMPQVPREQRVKRAVNDDADRARIQGETAEEIIGSFFDHIKKMPMFQRRPPQTENILNEMNETGELPPKDKLTDIVREAYPDNIGIRKRTRQALNEEPVNTQRDHMGAHEMGKQRSREASEAFENAKTHDERMSALDQQRDAYNLPKREPTGDDDVSNMIRELRGKEAAEKADWEAKWLSKQEDKNLLDPEETE
jgi:hypothetical protein